MIIKKIAFTKINTAEIIEVDVPVSDNSVVVKTAFSTISCGTEKANITGNPNIAGPAAPSVKFPRVQGYCSSGIVSEVGKNVKSVNVGDRVAMYCSQHGDYNVLPENNVIKLDDDNTLEEAALAYIASFPMAAIRKTNLEIGEPCMVMGLGILGQFAVQFARAAGACPVIAVDPVKERREIALTYGADYAFDPFEEGFAAKVKEVTDGGVNACIEVTGVGSGLDLALDCMRRFGRVALLGCTRDKEFTIDYYRKVHSPGITLIGAHTMARPENESHHSWYTHRDDIKAILKLCAMGRVDLQKTIVETCDPKDCFDIYTRLINDKNFPIVVQFDWSKL